MAHVKDVFQSALSDFTTRLTPKEQNDFQLTTFDDVRREIARIQTEQENSKTMRNMVRIQSFLEAMDQFGEIVEVFLNTSSLLAFVWGPMKFILKTASHWIDAFDILLDAYRQIGEHIPLLKRYKAIFEYDSNMRNVLGFIYQDILEFHKGALRFFSGPVWRQVFHSVWKDFGARFRNILGRLRSHRDLIADEAALLHFQQYQQDRLEIIDRLKETETLERHRQYSKVMEWISGAQTGADHEACCAIRSEYPGSGQWILKHVKLQNWMEANAPTSSVLWLNGIPGAGKTILSSIIIEACIHDKAFTTSYFYCKDGDPTKNNCIAIFKGLLNQLLSQRRDLVPYCHDSYLRSGELTLSLSTLSTQLLELFCNEVPRQYIIIDGLDECDVAERKLIMTFFTTMASKCDAYDPGKLRVLIVSQIYNDIKIALPLASVISLGPADNASDIRSYVDKWAIRIQEKFELSHDQIEAVGRSTRARARGMFLFAKLVMPNLYAQPTRQKLLEEIATDTFPRGLEQAYERILRRVKQNARPGEWEVAHKLLGWMLCAKRPLKWYEIQCALSIDPDDQTIDFKGRKLRTDIQDLCGSLIQVLPGDSSSSYRVELVHSTAKIYITSTGHISEFSVECSMAALCLRYLTFECFDMDIDESLLGAQARSGYLAFQDYAIAKGLLHLLEMVRCGEGVNSKDLDTEAALQGIGFALDEFTDKYENEIMYDTIEDVSEEMCRAFELSGFHQRLLYLWSHAYKHQQQDFATRNRASIKSLGQALTRNREMIERRAEEADEKARDLSTYYGRNIYKCPKLTCFFFHEGFRDCRARESHINRHDRPFLCTSPDCSIAEFGFASKKDLEKHKRSYHPEPSDLAQVFPSVDTPSTQRKWPCPQCDKKFTRGFAMRNHILTHTGDRPYACSHCGKAFTREHDRERHEKLHNRRP